MVDNPASNSNVVPPQPVNQTPYPPISAVPQASSLPQIQSPEPDAQGNPFYLTFGFWAFILFLGNLVTIFFLWFYPLLSPPLLIDDQPLGAGFYLRKVRVSAPGFVAFKVKIVGVEGPKILTIANSAVLTPDTYDDLFIPRIAREELPDEFLAGVDPGSSVSVALYSDTNGDGEVDTDTENMVMKDIFGRKVETTIILE